MSQRSIAILGATSHIAKGLICNFLEHGGFRRLCAERRKIVDLRRDADQRRRGESGAFRARALAQRL